MEDTIRYDLKECSICKIVKNLSLFPFRDKNKNIIRAECKLCVKNRKDEYYIKNRDELLKEMASRYVVERDSIISYQKEYRNNPENKEKINKRSKEYRDKNKETIAIKNGEYYIKNRESIIKRVSEYVRENEEKIKALQASYYLKNKDSIIKRAAQYAIANKDTISVKTSAYKKAHRPECNARSAAREAKKRNATPVWLTNGHYEQMEETYILAKELQWLSEEPLHVDHIIPLQGENVSGLHVPWNLQVLPAFLNISKSNKFDYLEYNNTYSTFGE